MNKDTRYLEKYQFKKGQSGNPNGRPKNRVPEILAKVMPKKTAKKFYGLTGEEVETWETSILGMKMDDLTLLAKNVEAPTYARGLAMGILTDIKNGRTTTLDKLRERAFGKTVQKMEVTGANGADLIPARALTKDEAQELWKDMDRDF